METIVHANTLPKNLSSTQTTFLNFDLDGKTPTSFLVKHVVFSLTWIFGLSLMVFRFDLILLSENSDLVRLTAILPLIYFLLIAIILFTQKWYFTLALFFYPILCFFWFIPKLILRNGKIYLFAHYIDGLFNKVTNYKKTIIHFLLFSLVFLLLILTNNNFIRWLSIIITLYFFLNYIKSYIKRSFQPAKLFGANIESFLNKLINNKNGIESSFILKLINSKEDEKVPKNINHEKLLTRFVLVSFCLDHLSKNLNGFKGKRSYLISWLFELLFFLFTSIIVFWFINFQLYKIDSTNYIISSSTNAFDFFYYTVKTFTFNGIDSIKPLTAVTKLSEMSAFFIFGVLILVIFASVVFALRQDKINENIKLTTIVCTDQNRLIQEYMKDKFGTDVQTALQEVSSIGRSLDSIKSIINKIF